VFAVLAFRKQSDAVRGGRQRLPKLTSRRLILLAGFALIAVGILCLCLSGAVAHSGSWWQGTLDAFGVGFTVGGVVDVLAISVLNQVLASEQERREAGREAMAITRSGQLNRETVMAAKDLIRERGSQLDPSTRWLLDLYVAAEPKVEAWERARMRRELFAAARVPEPRYSLTNFLLRLVTASTAHRRADAPAASPTGQSTARPDTSPFAHDGDQRRRPRGGT
jgi:hypothetical protein